ncbi:DUF4245 domain-containing protein [uncultured Modestobacter sp.]|uniref:DUF4245 domain-containing protein n=1 Tax=uncultured Modestobacter sp. TaxID=380048 RepID=UPI00262AF71C|nr:DUF4245 domain-containing protein [uncultured Modestobacter sp.]
MPDTGQHGQHPEEQATAVPTATPGAGDPAVPAAGATAAAPDGGGAAPAAAPAVDRMQRFTAANMIRSLLPLLVICLVLVGWSALKYNGGDPVREVDPTSAERAVAEVAGYPVLVPRGLPEEWRPTSVRTDAGAASAGDPVTLQIGWYTPAEEYAGYVISDDADADALTAVLDDATDDGTEQVGGQTWDRRIAANGETALTRTEGDATLLVTGSASDEELTTLAGSLQPY